MRADSGTGKLRLPKANKRHHLLFFFGCFFVDPRRSLARGKGERGAETGGGG